MEMKMFVEGHMLVATPSKKRHLCYLTVTPVPDDRDREHVQNLRFCSKLMPLIA
jgi:hypothetical protein